MPKKYPTGIVLPLIIATFVAATATVCQKPRAHSYAIVENPESPIWGNLRIEALQLDPPDPANRSKWVEIDMGKILKIVADYGPKVKSFSFTPSWLLRNKFGDEKPELQIGNYYIYNQTSNSDGTLVSIVDLDPKHGASCWTFSAKNMTSQEKVEKIERTIDKVTELKELYLDHPGRTPEPKREWGVNFEWSPWIKKALQPNRDRSPL